MDDLHKWVSFECHYYLIIWSSVTASASKQFMNKVLIIPARCIYVFIFFTLCACVASVICNPDPQEMWMMRKGGFDRLFSLKSELQIAKKISCQQNRADFKFTLETRFQQEVLVRSVIPAQMSRLASLKLLPANRFIFWHLKTGSE